MRNVTADPVAAVLADPTAYADETRLHAALAQSARHQPRCLGGCSGLPAVLGDHQARRHHGHRAEQHAVHQLAAPGADDRPRATSSRPAMGISTLIHMDDPQHRVVRAIGADWFRPKAMRALKVRVDELAKRIVDKMVDVGPRVRLRPGGRGQLPALRHHVAARPARGGLSADAEIHPGAVRQRRCRVQARWLDGGAAAWRCSRCSTTSTR